MKYTVQVPVMMTLVVEAESVEAALDDAAEMFHDAEIQMKCEYDVQEDWEDAEVYDENGELVDE